MSVDKDTVRRIARLARLAVPETARAHGRRTERHLPMGRDAGRSRMSTGVPAMTSVVAQKLKWREDKVTDGGKADALMQQRARAAKTHFFVVPKVVE